MDQPTSAKQQSRVLRAAVEKGLISSAMAEEAQRQASSSQTLATALLIKQGVLTQHIVDSLSIGTATATDPQLVAGFRILGRLGQGGMGTVYRAMQVSMNREVALKIIARQYAADPGFCDRFLREARSAGAVNHPNVITCFDVGQDQEWLYMALELMTGGDASTLCKDQGGRLDEPRALRLIADCARGLSALKRAGLIHRDIKPANIFISEDGIAKLGDLGLARSTSGDDRMTMTGAAMGTPAFMSPEQASGEADLDIRTDIYALGATLFSLLTGETPFKGASAFAVVAKVINDPVPDPRLHHPPISDGAAAIVLTAMAKDRQHRYQHPEAMIEDLERVLTGRDPITAQAIERPLGARPPVSDALGSARTTPLTHPVRRPTTPLSSPTLRAADGAGGPQSATAPTVPPASGSRTSDLATVVTASVRPLPSGDPGQGSSLGLVLAGVLGAAALTVGAVWLLAGHGTHRAIPSPSAASGMSSTPVRRPPVAGGVLTAAAEDHAHPVPVPQAPPAVAVQHVPADTDFNDTLTITPLHPTQDATPAPSLSLPDADVLPARTIPLTSDPPPNHPPASRPGDGSEVNTAHPGSEADPGRQATSAVIDQVSAHPAVPPRPAPPAAAVPHRSIPVPAPAPVTGAKVRRPRVVMPPGVLDGYRRQLRDSKIEATCADAGDGTVEVELDPATRDISGLVGIPVSHLDCEDVTHLSPLGILAQLPLRNLSLHGCTSISDLSPLQGLRLETLDLTNCENLQTDLEALHGMPLRELHLAGCRRLQSLAGIEQSRLSTLDLTDCRKIVSLEPVRSLPLAHLCLLRCSRVVDLDPLSSSPLVQLDLTGCESVTSLAPLHGTPLDHLSLEDCRHLTSLDGLSNMPLRELSMTHCTALRSLEGLQAPTLVRLIIVRCDGLTSLAGIENASKLATFEVTSCSNLRGDLSAVQGLPLRSVTIRECPNLTSLHGLEEAPLRKVVVVDCKHLGDLSPVRRPGVDVVFDR